MEPSFPIFHARMREWDEVQGDFEDARRHLGVTFPEFSKIKSQPGKLGYWRESLDLAALRKQQTEETFFDRVNQADAWAQLGDRDKAFQCLERSFQAQDELLPAFLRSALLDPLHSDPRWAALLKKLNMPE
jgi:hypothetical protein